MDWVVFLCGIFARQLEDDVSTSWVTGEKFGDLS